MNVYIQWSLAMRRVENEMMSMKLVAWGMKTWPLGMKYHVQGTKCLCLVWNESTVNNKKSFHKVWNCCIKVWKKFSRSETNFKGMKLMYKGMKNVFKVWNKLQGMKLFSRVWKSTFWVWRKTNFCKFPISYPRVWKFRLFFPVFSWWAYPPQTGSQREAGKSLASKV